MSLKMRAEVRDELVKRLRSGKYIQGKEKLAVKGEEGERFCCLGVLCEMAVEHGITKRSENDNEYWDFEGEENEYVTRIEVSYGNDGGSYDATLPPEVAIWAGLLTEDDWTELTGLMFDDGPGMGRFADKVDINKPTENSLAGLNDNGVPFTEIADFIEKNVEVVE